MATKLEGGGGKTLVAGPVKNNFYFLRLPLVIRIHTTVWPRSLVQFASYTIQMEKTSWTHSSSNTAYHESSEELNFVDIPRLQIVYVSIENVQV